jgi:hypothetical protein
MTIDILFLAKNRLEFTRESLAALEANTNWDLVRKLWICDDRSTDGTERLWPAKVPHLAVGFMPFAKFGSPAAIMNSFAMHGDPPDVFAKIDNDTIVPPGWLDQCVAVMEAHPDLDLLGIEPPSSRTPHYEGGKRSECPELTGSVVYRADNWLKAGYAPCDSIGGIGLMRTKCFLDNEPLKPHSIYGGFTEWQLQHPRIRKGWIVPPLDVFLLDRLPFGIWAELSKEYESKGWQRAWSKYPKDSTLWKWWTPVAKREGQPSSAESVR